MEPAHRVDRTHGSQPTLLHGIITNASTCLRMLDANPPNIIGGASETAPAAPFAMEIVHPKSSRACVRYSANARPAPSRSISTKPRRK